MRIGARRIVGGVAAILLLVAIIAWSTLGNTWYVEAVDGSDAVGSSLDLVISSDDVVHILYRDDTNNTLKHAHGGRSGWSFEIADPSGLVGGVGGMAIDQFDVLHAVYYANLKNGALYARKTLSGWHVEHARSTDNYWSGPHSSIAVDDDGNPYISLPWSGRQRLEVVFRDATGWVAREVQDVDYCDSSTSAIAVESDGSEIHVIYHKYTSSSDTLKYWWGHHTTWSWASAVSNAGPYADMLMADNGVLQMSYYNLSSGSLSYGYNHGSGWWVEDVDTTGDVGKYTAIAIDSSGFPHIAYYDVTNSALKYAYLDQSGWHIETVDSEGDVGRATGIGIDSNGNPHIAYYDSTNGDVKYATKGGSAYTTEYVVAHWINGALDPNDPCEINLDQILQAIAWWADATEIPETGGQMIDLDKMLDLIAKWAAATCIDAPFTPMSVMCPHSAVESMAESPAVSVYRTIAPSLVNPGDTVRVELTVQAVEDISGLGLDEDLVGFPGDWSPWVVTVVDSDGASYNAAEKQWVWLTLKAGDTRTIVYDVVIPVGTAPGAYQLTGSAMSSSPVLTELVSGDNAIILGTLGDPTGDSVVDICDIRLCYQIALGLVEGSAYEKAMCDIDGDGDVDQGDAELIIAQLRG